MANKTVYPYGTGGRLPSSIGLINDLRTGGVDKALTAEQGKVIGNLLLIDKEPDLSTYYHYIWWINNSNKWEKQGAGESFQCLLIPLDGVVSFRCTADGGSCSFAFLKTGTRVDGGDPDFAAGYTAKFYLTDGNTQEYDVPSDAKYLYIFATLTAGTDILGRYKDFTLTYNYLDELAKQQAAGVERAIYPALIYYTPTFTSTNNKGQPGSTYYGTGSYSTPRFIAIRDKNLSFTPGETRRLTIYEYDSDFNLLGYNAVGEVTGGTSYDYVCSHSDTEYIKVRMVIDTEMSGNAKSTLKIVGKFPEDWDVFNVRNLDSGYQNIAVSVRVTDPTCCDEETSTVQDDSQILSDYGVICLPDRYSNTGKPTRLIIYCHGAAVNYSSGANRFNSVDLDPTYWLAEGYAVLDIEGNPFNNTDEHICIPQSLDCYIAAYKWAIEFYNICRDGVFVGGRSMGGQMAFNLMRRECPIPVIAACPNSAAPDISFGYSDTAERKAFCALHMGFVEPEGFTWSNGRLTAEEKQVLSDNWDKYIKCCPQLSACVNLPSKETLIENMYGEEVIALWSTLHMVAKCPVKLFGCNQDQSCTPERTSALYYRMLINAGQIAECRLYNSYKDYTGTGTSAHHYDTQDPALRTTVTTSFGEELTNVPIVYIEMLSFWRRYEQGL